MQFQQALERVRAGADVMPQGQLHKVIEAELGVNWRNRMATFEDEPLAAASIGQVSPLSCHITFEMFKARFSAEARLAPPGMHP